MSAYNLTALALAAAYGTLAIWAVLVAYRQHGRYADVPILVLVAATTLIWSAWYLYLLIWHPAAGGLIQLLNRTIHAPTLVLFAVAVGWRARRP